MSINIFLAFIGLTIIWLGWGVVDALRDVAAVLREILHEMRKGKVAGE